jgi:hypothetical protein
LEAIKGTDPYLKNSETHGLGQKTKQNKNKGSHYVPSNQIAYIKNANTIRTFTLYQQQLKVDQRP